MADRFLRELGKKTSRAPNYVYLIPLLTEAARKVGYAVAIHGSMQRDLDVIAVPWVDDAADFKTLVAAIIGAIHGYKATDDKPQRKPHGRISVAIQLGFGPYIDLSVMPRATK